MNDTLTASSTVDHSPLLSAPPAPVPVYHEPKSVFSPPDFSDDAIAHLDFSSLDLSDLGLRKSELRFLLTLPSTGFDVSAAVRKSYCVSARANKIKHIMENRKIQTGVARLENFVQRALTEAAAWEIVQSIKDARRILDECMKEYEKNKEERNRVRKLREVAESSLDALRASPMPVVVVESVGEAGGRPKDVVKEAERVRSGQISDMLRDIAMLFGMERDSSSEMRKWLQRREFWKDNLDSVGGLKKENVNVKQSGGMLLGHLQGIPDADLIRIASMLSAAEKDK